MFLNEDWATIYGVLIGDGCLSRCGRARFIVVTCSIYDDQLFFDKIVIPKLENLRGKSVKYYKRPKYGKIEINFSDKKLFGKLTALGFPIGLKGDISIPDAFSDDLWPHIIAGVFATDGSLVLANNNGTRYPRIEFHCTAPTLINQIRDFLLVNGIKGGVYRVEDPRGKPTFRLEIPGKKKLLKFKELVGFINPKHQKKFSTYSDSAF